MIHASLFSGIGGPEVAAQMMGWINAFHCEINPFGRAVLDYWFPESKSYEDITKTSFKEWRGQIDVLTGGFPCQPFSYAGKRGGRTDDRYLWPEMLRVIDEVRPTWVVGENVAGITTMVEGGVLTPLGSDTSLFAEGDEFHRYELDQSFTLERICGDLEHLGYSVQSVLVPAAGVGAPHRRDRIFIIAHDDVNHTDRRADVRSTGQDEGEKGEKRVSERDNIHLVGDASEVRSQVQGDTEDTKRVRRVCGLAQEEPGHGRQRFSRAGDNVRVCGEAGIPNADTDCTGREEPKFTGREADCPKDGEGVHDRTQRSRRDGDAPDTDLQRFYERINPSQSGEEERFHCEANREWGDTNGLYPESRWNSFPTVSPVHRGNDGIPFPLDNLTIPQTRWRFESLKAYGNAIVPQVMYRIFQSIEAAEKESKNLL